jgi:hypothetical protein
MATYRKLLKNRAGDTIIPIVDVDIIYPVGSIYLSVTMSSASQVETAFGGTWVAWGAGRVPVGVDTSDTAFDTVEETGGEKTHTLTVEEMPIHKHDFEYGTNTSGAGIRATVASGNGPYYSGNPIGNSGGDQAHNNLQPYITCYMYKRIA